MGAIKENKPKNKLNLFLFILLTLLLGILVFTRIREILTNDSYGPYVNAAWNFVWNDKSILNSHEGRTNILVLGKSGEGHDSPELTDSIMIASLDNEGVTLVSIPRDIWIDDLKTKINSLYYYGQKRENDTGIAYARKEIEKLLNIPIHYVLVLDFEAFIETVDVLGGVDVNVTSSFTDEKYPIEGMENDLCNGDPEFLCRYETISFEKGASHMDGDAALKFVRSRNAEGDEGTDLARSARQQLVFSAILNKFLSRDVLSSKESVESTWSVINSSIETDLDMNQLAVLARTFYDYRKVIKTLSIPEDLFLNPPPSREYEYLYVFIPSGNWENIRNWFSSILN
ncbi:LCP family protein [Patescibacteria group bacterium]